MRFYALSSQSVLHPALRKTLKLLMVGVMNLEFCSITIQWKTRGHHLYVSQGAC